MNWSKERECLEIQYEPNSLCMKSIMADFCLEVQTDSSDRIFLRSASAIPLNYLTQSISMNDILIQRGGEKNIICCLQLGQL